MRRLALAALASLLAAPAWAQGSVCGDAQIIATSTGTQRVPRMGPSSDLLTQTITVQNMGPMELRLTITLTHRAFEQDFVAGQVFTLRANGTTDIMLGNVHRPGLTLPMLRATVRIAC